MRWISASDVFGKGESYFAHVSESFSKQYINQNCEVEQTGLYGIYRQRGLLLTAPAPGVNFEWKLRVPMESIPLGLIVPQPYIYVTNPPIFKVTLIK